LAIPAKDQALIVAEVLIDAEVVPRSAYERQALAIHARNQALCNAAE
jgi:hypothetical protein